MALLGKSAQVPVLVIYLLLPEHVHCDSDVDHVYPFEHVQDVEPAADVEPDGQVLHMPFLLY